MFICSDFTPDISCVKSMKQHFANKQEEIFYLECNGRQGALASYGFFFGSASKHSAGTHLTAHANGCPFFSWFTAD